MSKEPNRGDNTGPPATADLPAAILEMVNEDFAFAVDAVQVAPSGVGFFTGWTDVRPSRLHQVRIRGRCWSKAIDSQYLGRYRQPTLKCDTINTQRPLCGFWSIALQ